MNPDALIDPNDPKAMAQLRERLERIEEWRTELERQADEQRRETAKGLTGIDPWA